VKKKIHPTIGVMSGNKAEVAPGTPKAPFKPPSRRHLLLSNLNLRAHGHSRKSQKSSKKPTGNENEDTQIRRGHGEPSISHDSPTPQRPQDSSTNSATRSATDIATKSQQDPSIPSEPPLKRPRDPISYSGPTEEPLSRPRNNEEEVAFSDIVATFAVDVSGSTEGKVLEEEKGVLSLLCSGLSRDSQTQARIIPWSHVTYGVLRSSELHTLQSAGGTIPNCLNEEPNSKNALSKCSTWFLLTDGEIDQNNIRDFSKGVCEASLHGTPCVIVLFGYKTSRPALANISVGLSVFSNATDCLFLFHDIESTQVYILQSKGKFNEVLPPGCHELILDRETLWGGLPTFHYRQLFDLPLPARQQLRPDDLLLQSGQKVNLQSLYQHQIESSVARDIMENDDNLKSVLLAAQLRGRDDDIIRWVSKQKSDMDDILHCDRPDINDQAAQLMEELLQWLFSKDPDRMAIGDLRHRLRTAHFANWGLFLESARAHPDSSAARKTLVSDAMSRISSNRRELDSPAPSPMILGPVSPGGQLTHSWMPRRSGGDSETHSYSNSRFPCAPKLQSRQLPEFANHVPDRIPKEWRLSDCCTNMLELRNMKNELGENAGVLYIKAFKEEISDTSHRADCPLCGQDGILLIALVKAPPKDLVTPGFPSPGQRKGLVYPLAMGSYPETDVLSSYVCCDSCAFTLVKKQMLINGDEITAAIPLTPSAYSGQYRQTTFDLIDNAFQKRFHKSAVLLVFLAAIYNTIANIDGDSSRSRMQSLEGMARSVANTAALPMDLSMSIAGTTPRTGTFGDPHPLPHVISKVFLNLHEPESPLLQYPLGGFIVLALAAENDGIGGRNQRQIAIWHRFLYHLVEKHCDFIKTDPARAVAALNVILHPSEIEASDHDAVLELSPNKPAEPSVTKSHNPEKMSCIILRGTHFLSEDDFDEFERLGNDFQQVIRKSDSALKPFLQQLSQETPKASPAIDVFDTMRASENLSDVFQVS